MKKLLSIFITFALCLTFVFAFTGCGGNNDGGKNTISAQEWSSLINDSGFTVETGGYVKLKLAENSYEKYSVSGGTVLPAKVYLNGAYEVQREGGKWQQMQPINQTVYQQNIQGIKGIIEYVKENPNAFKFGNSKYTMALTGDVLQTELTNVANVFNVVKSSLTSLQVEKKVHKTQSFDKSYVVITLVSENGANDSLVITLRTPVLQYDLEKEISRLTNFSIKGGPSYQDVDYVELYFVQDGFRIYAPNDLEPTERDMYLKYDSSADKYYQYKQTPQGVWTREDISYLEYETAKNNAFSLYLGNFLEQSEYLVCWFDNARCCSDGVIKKEMAMGEWSYFNVSITVANSFSLSSGARWNMQLKVRETEAQSLVYNMELQSVGSVVLNYPEIA